MIIKHKNSDKWDAYIPNKPGLVHTNWCISKYDIKFHNPNGWYEKVGADRGRRFGTTKRLVKASSYGYFVDGHYTGKTES